MEDLPGNYDLIVIGTGMPECIIAAAAARAGKSVLHLDRNSYYGGDWASFNFEQLISWVQDQKDIVGDKPATRMLEATWLEQLDDSERLVLCPKKRSTVTSITQYTYAKEKRPVPEPPVEQVSSEVPEISETQNSEECISAAEQGSSETVEEAEKVSGSASSDGNNDNEIEQSQDAANNSEAVPSGSNVKSDVEQTSQEQETSPAPDSAGDEGPKPSTDNETGNSVAQDQELTLEDIHDNRRKFNIDLSPKLLFSRGSLVELLISSNIARYAEFQSVNRILTHINGHLEQVPCSRADVFSTKNVNVVEKRMLMKLLTFCIEYQKHPEEYRGFEGRPFIEFLKSKKVTENIMHFVLHAIAMVDETCPTLQGLVATQRFMESLGRYGNSPFLCTCYGSAELPQCFCRLCAVFGGIYYLKRDADAVILNAENRCSGIISNGRKLKCQSLVMEYSYAPLEYIQMEQSQMVSRAIYVTDGSIMPAERQQNTLLRLPPLPGVHNAITVLEFGSLSYICPDKFYVVHMISQSTDNSVEEEFRAAEQELFENPSSAESNATGDAPASGKPKILWCSYFKFHDLTNLDLNANTPEGIFLTSSSDAKLDYEHAVKEAREIFENMYPGEEFLPRAPDPEDIVMDDHSNPGEGIEGNSEENDNIENDHVEEDDSKEQASENSTDESNQSNTTALSELAEEAVIKDATE